MKIWLDLHEYHCLQSKLILKIENLEFSLLDILPHQFLCSQILVLKIIIIFCIQVKDENMCA